VADKVLEKDFVVVLCPQYVTYSSSEVWS